MKNYELLEQERTKVLVRTESQRVVEKEAETARKRAVIEAEMAAQTSAILMEQRLKEKLSQQKARCGGLPGSGLLPRVPPRLRQHLLQLRLPQRRFCRPPACL